jgi:hypothetical protein
LNSIISLFDSVIVLFSLNPLAQTTGLIALIIGASAFFHKDDQKLKYYLTAFTLLMAIHFFLLGLWVAALMALLGSARNYVSSLTNNIGVMFTFLLVAWVFSLPNINEWVQLLPAIGVSMGTWAVFREKGLRMRFYMSIGTVCWFSHNFLVGSIGGVLIESIFLLVNGRTMLQLFKEQANNPQSR